MATPRYPIGYQPDPPQQFTLLGPNGETIMSGDLSVVTEPLLDSSTRAEAEQLLIDAAKACGLLESIAEREDSISTREEAYRSEQVQKMLDGIANLNSRIDVYLTRRDDAERQAIQAELDALPDPDNPAHHLRNGELSAVVPAPVDPLGTSLDDAGLENSVVTRSANDPKELGGAGPTPARPVSISLNEE